jgi:hypothetical protein
MRKYLVREARDADHPRMAPLNLKGDLITIIRLADGRAWCFAKRTRRFRAPFENCDQYAVARLASGERDLDRAIAWCGL